MALASVGAPPPPLLVTLMNQMLSMEPTARPSMASVLQRLDELLAAESAAREVIGAGAAPVVWLALVYAEMIV